MTRSTNPLIIIIICTPNEGPKFAVNMPKCLSITMTLAVSKQTQPSPVGPQLITGIWGRSPQRGTGVEPPGQESEGFVHLKKICCQYVKTV